jgi:tetrapyrrole methylase family protein/MazG family protein
MNNDSGVQMIEEDKGFDRLVKIMRRLRSPGGCPWDAEQTHESLKRYLLEECYEVIEAIDTNDPCHLKEELGDLMLQPVFHAAIAAEKGEFTIDDVLDTVCNKLIHRHPHVFGDQVIKSADEQVENWERIKKKKRERSGNRPWQVFPLTSRTDESAETDGKSGTGRLRLGTRRPGIRESSGRAARTGGDDGRRGPGADGSNWGPSVCHCEPRRFSRSTPNKRLARRSAAFTQRFGYIEETLHAGGRQMKDATLEEMDLLWEEAKGKERQSEG